MVTCILVRCRYTGFELAKAGKKKKKKINAMLVDMKLKPVSYETETILASGFIACLSSTG